MKKLIMLLLVSSVVSLGASCKIAKLCPEAVTGISIVIDEPGKYILCNDFEYTGPDAAIQIKSSNVELCLFAHNITLTDRFATGIEINKGTGPENRICEITINNDSIKHVGVATAKTTGISIDNACKVRLHNMFTKNHAIGLSIENSSDVCVERSEFASSEAMGASVSSSEAVTFDNCVFKDNSVGLSTSGPSKDCKVLNCSFLNSAFASLELLVTDGVLVKNSSFSKGTGTEERDMVFLRAVNNARFECCTFAGKEKVTSAINFVNGSNLIVDSCSFAIEDDPDAPSATIQLAAASSNTHITGCMITGADQEVSRIGVQAEGSQVVVQDTVIRDVFKGIVFGGDSKGNAVRSSNIAKVERGIELDGTGHEVSDSVVSDIIGDVPLGDGIFVDGTLHSVVRNVISNYNECGIQCVGTSSACTLFNNDVLGGIDGTAIGIFLRADSTNHLVHHNRVHTNIAGSGTGIDDNGTTNKVFSNTAHNNNDNYEGIPAALEVSVAAPVGTLSETGTNLTP